MAGRRIISTFINAIKRAKHLFCLRDKNGKKYRKSVMLYGFYGMNLGDDMFFEKLLTRYPDTMFLLYVTNNYRVFFEKFDNVKFYAVEDPFVQKVNRIGNKLKIRDLFELLLLKRSSATVHIGGSIYQQVGDYENDYKNRLRRKQAFKPFYSISCNFGAYKTEEYKLKWRKQFVKFKDICFRDRYSYNLFSDVKSVRYAPDLLFSHKAEEQKEIPGSVSISLFNPYFIVRNLDKSTCEAYRMSLVNTVTDLINNGQKVTLLGFCTFEGDASFIEDILRHLPDDIGRQVEYVNYSFYTKNEVLSALASSEYIIGTRLHSVILGLAMNKKVLPIIYNSKMKYILDDIGYNQPTIELDQLVSFEQTGFTELLNQIERFDVSAYSNSDQQQFYKLDKFLK